MQAELNHARPDRGRGDLAEGRTEEHLIAVVSKSNPLARRKTLRIKDLADEALFLPDRTVGSGLRDKILELYAKAGLTPRISPLTADPVSSNDVHKVLLAANKGIFILEDEIGTRADSSSVAMPIPIEDPDARIELYVVWRKNEKSSSVLALLDTARRVLSMKLHLSTPRSTTPRVAASA
jgi:DNA-binding transcriptional LysR family regulator